LVTLHIDATDADASGFEPVKCDGKLVGCVTSGAYGHSVKQSLALAYVDHDIAIAAPALTVDVIGETRAARILREPVYDPMGLRLRS
jgi:dimethylglycine dehydrogenase